MRKHLETRDCTLRTDLSSAKVINAGLNAHILHHGKHLAGQGSLKEAGLLRSKT